MQVVCVININNAAKSKNKGKTVDDKGNIEDRKTAYAQLQKACDSCKADLHHIAFEHLDFGSGEVLDQFYNADLAVVDMSIQEQQASLFYHIGVRESMGAMETVIILNDINPEFTLSVKLTCGSSDFLPYQVDSDGRCVVSDEMNLGDSMGKGTNKVSPMPLVNKLKRILKELEKSHKAHIKEKFLSDLRKARDQTPIPELGKVLKTMRNRLDDPQLLTPDVIFNLLISFRDVQDYDSMVTLVQDIDVVNSNVCNTVAIQHLYAFALNRRKSEGDRGKALEVIHKAIEMTDVPAPDLLGLCGRIYKDKFVESNYEDKEALQQGIKWYQKGFDVQPNEYTGINLATLLVISGKRLSSSTTLQRIALTLNNLIGRKGSLSTLTDYWDVATFFEISVLAEDYVKAVQAAECMFRLEPPIWYLKSTLGNIQLIVRFMKDENETLNSPKTREKELFHFWMEYFFETTKKKKVPTATLR